MAWIYEQKTGRLVHEGRIVAVGYSGHELGKNNPEAQAVHGVGPIPCGDWEIHGPPFQHETAGPHVLRLQPAPDTQTFGRSGFLIHGDAVDAPGTASHGCIILPRAIRDAIWDSGDRYLTVEPGVPRPDLEVA